MELAYAPYRLLFKHPFGTAHGLRIGTDSVFVRLRRGGKTGFGEATLPPYLDESISTVVQCLGSIDLKFLVHDLDACSAGRSVGAAWAASPATRAALTTAYFDLIAKEKEVLISSFLTDTARFPKAGLAMVTLGHTPVDDIALKLSQLPSTTVLKLKVGGPEDELVVRRIMELDDRKLFLDANQGWDSVDQALGLIHLAGAERVIGVEQPFGKDRWDLHAELERRTAVPIYGDESIQGLADLDRAQSVFGGVNIKLMKCGGLDVAKNMAERATELGMRVMLGSMSESSLGCGAMAQLAHLADVVDLDGPWLVRNDPFEGLELVQGRMRCAGPVGTGIRLREPGVLAWTPIGA